MDKGDALIVVDLQNDFLPGGSLEVFEGDRIIPIVNRLIDSFTGDRTFLTQDFHPASHGSFASNREGKSVGDVVDLNGVSQMLWPDHCVQGTEGVLLSDDLIVSRAKIVRKGMDPRYDSYSGFKDANGAVTQLERELLASGVDGASLLTICGLATDYCVKFTALDAIALGYRVQVVIDACRGVGIPEGSVEKAIQEMSDASIAIVKSEQILP
jgi:nicotinamidase/pyrazinamidase